jgi:hypothetical protein
MGWVTCSTLTPPAAKELPKLNVCHCTRTAPPLPKRVHWTVGVGLPVRLQPTLASEGLLALPTAWKKSSVRATSPRSRLLAHTTCSSGCAGWPAASVQVPDCTSGRTRSESVGAAVRPGAVASPP